MKKETFVFSTFVLFSAVFAEEDYDKAVSKYKDIPADIDMEARWAEPYDETYLPYNRCRNVQNFEIVRVDERADYYWDRKDDLFDLYHYYCLVSIVRITYRVTCQNKLQYDGYSYFFSDPHKLNKFYNPSDEEIEKFKSYAHAWTEKPLRCIKDNGRFDESCSEFSGYDGALNREALIKSWEKQRVAFPEWTYLEEEFSGLKPIIDDLDAQEKGTPQIHDLITAKLDLYWYNYAYETAGAFTDGFGKIGLNSPLGIIQAFTPVVSALGWLYGATTDWITDVYLTVKGPYVGEYVPEVYIDGVGSGSFNVTKTLDTVKTMASVAREARKIRKAGAHLDANGTFMQNLGNAYPRRPDGTNVPLRPLYSPSTKRLLADLLYSLGEEASEICAKNDESRECFAAGDYFKAYAMEMAKDLGVAEINDGSTKQGLDISCALDFYCDRTLQKQGAGLVYLEQGSVGLTGDFDIAPMFTESGVQEVTVSDGTHFLKATYRPKTGSFVTYTDGSGNAVLDTVIGASVSTTPSVSREGQNISVSFNNYSGKMYAKTYPMPKLAENVTYSVGNGNNDILPRVVAGVANATDLSTQMPPSTPKDKFFAKSSIFALHREARGEQESNTSRPRILVANSSDNDIGGFKVAYYFTADPARNPVVEIDYPKIPVTLENLGGDQWRFILDASDSILKARSVFPGMDGWQIRIHYDDWSDYRHLNDWSADYNVGLPKIDRKIVVYGKGGEILWGAEPKMFKSVDDGVVVSPKGTVSWKDAAPWEKNMFKPQVTVSNTGSVNLRNYHAKMWFRVPAGKTLQPPPEDWYTPESKPSLTNVGRNVWELDMFFDRHILYSKESVTEGNVGLRLTDWSEFDKLVCGIALVDSDGNAIYGQIPSIEACEAYDGPNLLAPQYARRDMR